MRIIFNAITATIIAGSTVVATASTDDGDFAVYRWGARDCDTVVSILQGDQADQARAQIAEWISGYITALNRNEDGVYDVTPVKTHLSLVSLAQNICANNPDQLLESIVNAIVANLSSLRISTNSSIVSATHNEGSVEVHEATILRVQEFLIAEGHLNNGTADGIFGPNTAQALEAWQENAGLTPNGLPDIVTLFLIAQQISQQ